jgi:hypothetical protein
VSERERARERETDGKRNGEKKKREKFIDNQQVGWRVSVCVVY